MFLYLSLIHVSVLELSSDVYRGYRKNYDIHQWNDLPVHKVHTFIATVDVLIDDFWAGKNFYRQNFSQTQTQVSSKIIKCAGTQDAQGY